jgi:hypothetical protein
MSGFRLWLYRQGEEDDWTLIESSSDQIPRMLADRGYVVKEIAIGREHSVKVCDTCGAKVERNYRDRWECREHGDQITVHDVTTREVAR